MRKTMPKKTRFAGTSDESEASGDNSDDTEVDYDLLDIGSDAEENDVLDSIEVAAMSEDDEEADDMEFDEAELDDEGIEDISSDEELYSKVWRSMSRADSDMCGF